MVSKVHSLGCGRINTLASYCESTYFKRLRWLVNGATCWQRVACSVSTLLLNCAVILCEKMILLYHPVFIPNETLGELLMSILHYLWGKLLSQHQTCVNTQHLMMFLPLFGPLRDIRVSLPSSWIQQQLQLSDFAVNITQSLLTASFFYFLPPCERLRPSSRNRWLPSLNQWITPAAVSQIPNRSQTSRRVPSAEFTVIDHVTTDMENRTNRHDTLLFQGFFLSSSPSVSTWVQLCQGLMPPCLSKGWEWSPPCCRCLKLKTGNTGVTFWLVHFQLTAPAASSVLVQRYCKYS